MKYLETEVDPTGNPVMYNRSNEGLEAWMLFCIFVAGKGASQMKAALTRFLGTTTLSPFSYVRYLDGVGILEERLKEARTGQYSRLATCLRKLTEKHDANWLRQCSLADLEAVHGIGMKTSRFFMLSTRKNAACAALDTHLLKELRTQGAQVYLQKYNLHNTVIPTATPTKGMYLKLEKVILDMAQAKNMTPAEFDYEVWFKYYKGN